MTHFSCSKMNGKQVISLFSSAVCLSGGRREGGARTGMHSVCTWAHLVQNSLNQIRHVTTGVLHFLQDHEVHGHSLLLREGAQGRHLSKMSPATPCLWLPTALIMGVYGFEVK